MRRAAFGLAAATLLSVAAGCRRAAADPSAGDALVLALAATPDRPGYASLVRGAELALETLNAERSAGGRPPLVLARPWATARSAIAVASTWRDRRDVVGVVGHPESGATLETLPLYADLEADGARALPVVTPTATSPALAGRSPWLFRLAPSDAAVSRRVATLLADSLGLRRAAVVYRNDSYGRDWTAAFRAAWTAEGGQLVAHEPYVRGLMEWEAYAQLLARRAPDVVLFPGDAADAAELLAALRAAGARALFVGGDGTEALLATGAWPEARVISFFRADTAETAEGRAFIVRYRTRYGTAPDMFAAFAHDAALLLGRAAVHAEAVAPRDWRARRAAVRDWLATLGRGRPALAGVTGPLAFDTLQEVVARPIRLVAAPRPAGRERTE